MCIRLDDMHPAVDFDRQSAILRRVDDGRLTHAAADELIRANWPLCHTCGAISATVVNNVFYCLDCWRPAWARQLQRALDEGRAAAGGEVY